MTTSGTAAVPPSSGLVGHTEELSTYTRIPSFPACLGGEWRYLSKSPYLRVTMRFRAGTCLPPHHFPVISRITVIRGSLQLEDYSMNQEYLMGPEEHCVIPGKLVHAIQCLSDVEFELAINCQDWVIYWDLEER